MSNREWQNVGELPKDLPFGISEAYKAAREVTAEAKEPCFATSAISLQGAWYFDFVTVSGLRLTVTVNASGEARMHRIRGVL